MHFLPELQRYLLGNNFIYTVRRFRYRDEDTTVFIPGVGSCHRELIKEGVVQEDLIRYYGSSGFVTLEDWWNKIVLINPNLPKLYLYYVSVLRRLK